ncbi:MAG: hypothetical protein B6U95_07525 [Thermofilum sp. ex4484_82]|nr:MAG: hypothetical protein B6U95_07525 [Thermofilum sp. ex4484_82]OYT37072.1 MAG: hypothetical protein B6U96_07520 [Archaeoglobales archaeon ex4484_92]
MKKINENQLQKIGKSLQIIGKALQIIGKTLQKNRLDIINLLKDGKPRNISEIAKEIGLSRTATTYHLSMLEEIGLVEQKYEIMKAPNTPPVVGSFYTLNKKKLEQIIEILSQIFSTHTTNRMQDDEDGRKEK